MIEDPKIHKKVCPLCNKVFVYLNKKQLEWNYNIHFQSCKQKAKKKDDLK